MPWHRNMPKACPYVMMQFAPSASEMPHYAKHHASENRRAIARSLVIRTRWGDEPRRGSVMIVKNRLISRPTLSEAHIVCTLLSPSYASLRARTRSLVFRIIWHLRCLLLPLFQFSHSFSSEPQFVPSAIVADINRCFCCAKGRGEGCKKRKLLSTLWKTASNSFFC